jgi:hypothetical protein
VDNSQFAQASEQKDSHISQREQCLTEGFSLRRYCYELDNTDLEKKCLLDQLEQICRAVSATSQVSANSVMTQINVISHHLTSPELSTITALLGKQDFYKARVVMGLIKERITICLTD